MLDSPRFSFREARFTDIEQALDSTGHAVLEDVWNRVYLSSLRSAVEQKFEALDEQLRGHFDDYPRTTIDAYLSGTTDLPSLFPTFAEQYDADRRFFSEVDRSGLPGLYRHLLNGDFMVGRSERVMRRFDPSFQMDFVELHADRQLGACTKEALNSNRSFTVWTPLQDCVTDDISRLVFLHRGETDRDLTSPAERHEVLEIHYMMRDPHKVAAYMKRVFSERRCYVPRVALGSAIIFCDDVVHGTYLQPALTKYRFSMDFRVVGDFRETAANAYISGVMYRASSRKHG